VIVQVITAALIGRVKVVPAVKLFVVKLRLDVPRVLVGKVLAGVTGGQSNRSSQMRRLVLRGGGMVETLGREGGGGCVTGLDPVSAVDVGRHGGTRRGAGFQF